MANRRSNSNRLTFNPPPHPNQRGNKSSTLPSRPRPLPSHDCREEGQLLQEVSQLSSLEQMVSRLEGYLRNNEPCLNIPVPPPNVQTTEDCGGLCGDVNNDGSLNVLDIVTTVQYILGIPGSEDGMLCPEHADINHDGLINVLDVVTLLNKILADDYVDTSCVHSIFGCVEPNAENYDPTALENDGSCIYPDWPEGAYSVSCNSNYDCTGVAFPGMGIECQLNEHIEYNFDWDWENQDIPGYIVMGPRHYGNCWPTCNSFGYNSPHCQYPDTPWASYNTCVRRTEIGPDTGLCELPRQVGDFCWYDVDCAGIPYGSCIAHICEDMTSYGMNIPCETEYDCDQYAEFLDCVPEVSIFQVIGANKAHTCWPICDIIGAASPHCQNPGTAWEEYTTCVQYKEGSGVFGICQRPLDYGDSCYNDSECVNLYGGSCVDGECVDMTDYSSYFGIECDSENDCEVIEPFLDCVPEVPEDYLIGSNFANRCWPICDIYGADSPHCHPSELDGTDWEGHTTCIQYKRTSGIFGLCQLPRDYGDYCYNDEDCFNLLYGSCLDEECVDMSDYPEFAVGAPSTEIDCDSDADCEQLSPLLSCIPYLHWSDRTWGSSYGHSNECWPQCFGGFSGQHWGADSLQCQNPGVWADYTTCIRYKIGANTFGTCELPRQVGDFCWYDADCFNINGTCGDSNFNEDMVDNVCCVIDSSTFLWNCG